MRILGIDYGSKRLGLAMSDEDEILASPLPVHVRTSLEEDLSFLTRLARRNKVETIVLGLPLNMNGSQGEMARAVQEFATELRRTCRVPVVLFDERLTTSEAERVLIQADISRKKRKNLRDGLAAVLILQGYLDSQRSNINSTDA
ncbi:MAG TPA: Holliday junction resolvase RuvX [Candidatus Acetothermia bacterium]|nr:Holliday junction resolvase RuvX [Candidatus Acetothermia bacterium]